MKNTEATQECQERLYNGTQCRKAAVTTVALSEYTPELRKPVCKTHAK